MRRIGGSACVLLAVVVWWSVRDTHSADAPAKPPVWTSGRVTGSPEPPPPYTPARVFPGAKFDHPLLIARMPGSARLFLGEQAGKLFSVDPAKPDAKPALFADLKADYAKLKPMKDSKGFGELYGLVFHPKFETNKTAFVCYTITGKKGPKVGPFNPEENFPDGSRVSRFTVTMKEGQAPVLDLASEEVVITFPQGGHNGGDLHFGPDGFLYISTGDATSPTPPDRFATGQDCSDLMSSVLRIDVDRKDAGLNYAIPKDNPFVGVTHDGKKVRPEVWSFGFRNPWRMSFDRKTGDLWLGDVGFENWEMVHKLSKGSNHGWSIVEARQPINTSWKLGPTPVITPAVVELDHSAAASVTGGYVYRGKKFPELVGKYIFGDYMTKRIWAAKVDGDRLLELVDLIDPTIRVSAFGEDHAGEIYFVDYDSGTVHTLEKNTAPAYDPKKFPKTLAGTGLYADVKAHTLASGVRPFSVNAPMWSDGATAERFVAVPNGEKIKHFEDRQKLGYVEWLPFHLVFPKDSVLGRTLTLELEPGKKKRIETQLLHFDGAFWQAYSYMWRDDQTDADLVPFDGAEKVLRVADKRVQGGEREQVWNFASRPQCLTCHTPWAEVTLGFNLDQLNKTVKAGEKNRNQLAAMCETGLLERLDKQKKAKPVLTDDTAAKLGKLTDPHDEKANLNDRARSYLHANCAHCHRNGGGGVVQMYLGKGEDLKKGAIDATPTRGDFGIKDAKIVKPGEPFRSTLMYRMAKFGKDRMPHIGAEVPDTKGLQLIARWIEGLKPGVEFVQNPADTLTDPAALLAISVMGPEFVNPAIVTQMAKLPAGPVRDLFEGFFPPQPGERKLGQNPRPKQILSLTGDAERGRAVFLLERNQCVNCHKHGTAGKEIGPDLTHIGGTRTREDLLESLLDPSRRVEPKFQSYEAKCLDGQCVVGVLVKKDAKGVTIRDAKAKDFTFADADLDSFRPSRLSLMANGLLADLTPQQAADLLEFLAKSKK